MVPRLVPVGLDGLYTEPPPPDVMFDPLSALPPSPISVPRKRAFRPAAAASPAMIDPPPAGWRRFSYLLLLLALLPLAIQTFTPKDDDQMRIAIALKKVILSHPRDLGDIHGQITPVKLVDLLPDHRIDGAFLPANTFLHFAFAAVVAVIFGGMLMLIFPKALDHPKKLIWTGLFTGTVGIFLLLALQQIAFRTAGVTVIGASIVMMLFWIIKFIGFSYMAALDPHAPLFASFFGFTCGVGLCEEFCKALPVLFRYHQDEPITWRAGCVLGMASGFGFGIAESIHYSATQYNGIAGQEIYWMRFFSCVVLHGLWTGAAAISLYKHRQMLDESTGPWQWFFNVFFLLIVSMALHGLYDTTLKMQWVVPALLVAVASLGWFMYQVETVRKKYGEQDQDDTAAEFS